MTIRVILFLGFLNRKGFRAMKDHEIAKLHNDLRDTAVKYKDAQQLRARLATVVEPLINENKRLSGLVPEVVKCCGSCKHVSVFLDDEPCKSCLGVWGPEGKKYRNWQPKDKEA